MGKRFKVDPQPPVGMVEVNNKPEQVKEPEPDKRKSEPVSESKPKNKPETKTTTQLGLPEGLTRTTIIIDELDLEKLRTLAFINKQNVSYYINEAITKYITGYEKKNNTIPTLR